jgi:hypothetical protein
MFKIIIIFYLIYIFDLYCLCNDNIIANGHTRNEIIHNNDSINNFFDYDNNNNNFEVSHLIKSILNNSNLNNTNNKKNRNKNNNYYSNISLSHSYPQGMHINLKTSINIFNNNNYNNSNLLIIYYIPAGCYIDPYELEVMIYFELFKYLII